MQIEIEVRLQVFIECDNLNLDQIDEVVTAIKFTGIPDENDATTHNVKVKDVQFVSYF